MLLRILCVGKLKERFFEEACREYTKRLGRYATVELVEIPDEKAPEQLSEAQKLQVKQAEGRRLLMKVEPNDFLVAMAIDGKQLDSEALSRSMEGWMALGKRSLSFVIGGSLGLSDEVLRRADFKLSFGKNTFPHQLFRVMLLEQVYRGFRILNHEPYHK